jgi:acyl-CoA synthetase (AMP-forming)/AMP-acid ligase II
VATASALGDRLRAALAADPAARCLEFGGVWWTWGDLAAKATDLDAQLTAAGLGAETAVGVVMRNHPASVAALAALLSTERALVVFAPHLPADVLHADIERRALGAVVGADGSLAIATGVAAADAPRLPGVAVEMLTSGTTGPPKRVPLLYATLEHSLLGSAPRPASGARIVWAPMAHLGGIWGVLQSLLGGQQLALMERFEVDGWVARVREHRPAVTGLPPSGLRMVLDAGVAPEDLAGLQAITTGTAAVPPDLVAEFEARYRVPVLVTYGATEFAGPIAGWTVDDRKQFGVSKRSSVGRPYGGVEVRVVDGVLEARGGQLATVHGDAWLRTSDLGHIDDDGFVYVDGRADDAILRGGFKVSAGVVATALEQHPAVAVAAVVGRPDERLGAVPVAAVELAPGHGPPGDGELATFLRERLSPFQIPVAFHIVAAVPRTPTMKVDSVAVRRLLGF